MNLKKSVLLIKYTKSVLSHILLWSALGRLPAVVSNAVVFVVSLAIVLGNRLDSLVNKSMPWPAGLEQGQGHLSSAASQGLGPFSLCLVNLDIHVYLCVYCWCFTRWGSSRS